MQEPSWFDIRGYIPRITPARVMLLLSVLFMFIPGYMGVAKPLTLKWKVNFIKSTVKALSPALGTSKSMLVYSALSMYTPCFFEPDCNPIPRPQRYAQPPLEFCPANHTMPEKPPRMQYYSQDFNHGFCPANHTFRYKKAWHTEEETYSEWTLPRAFYDPMLPYSMLSFVAIVLVPSMHSKYEINRKFRIKSEELRKIREGLRNMKNARR